MVKLSALLRKKADDIWMSIIRHPFLSEMGDGRLPVEKFKFYLMQDHAYLWEFLRCLALLISKAPNPEEELAMEELLRGVITTELENQKTFAKELHMDLRRASPTPTTIAYTNFLLRSCAHGSYLEGLTSMLPCAWTYLEIGRSLVARKGIEKNSIYRRWAEIYASRENEIAVDRHIQILDDQPYALRDRPRLVELFRTASRYEYMFWDMAYKLERWVI